jgi:tetratricopeptide (TPR) repeat protein
MQIRLRAWLTFPVRTRTRAVLSTVMLVVVAGVAWQGWRIYRFHQSRTAAEASLARYDFAEARRYLAVCLSLRPTDPEIHLLAVQAARRDGLLDEAQRHLDRYRELVGDATPDGALQAVLLRVQGGAVKEHVNILMDYIDIRHPQREQILEALAQGCVHVYRLDEASFWTRQLLDRFPENPIGRLLDAQTHETLRRRDQAIEITQKLVEDYPENNKARIYLAGLLFRRHRYDEAAKHYWEAHWQQPADIAPLLGLVRVLVAQERFDDVEPILRQLQREHADNSEALLECGRSALRQKRPAEAEPLLQRAVELAPNDHEIHLELAIALQQLGRTDEAQRHLERSQQIEADMLRLEQVFQEMVAAPSDPMPRLEAGRICLRNGQITEGLRWLFGALELAPQHKPTHAALADHFESIGNTASAEYHRARSR